jgi:hypothetical protein
MVEAAAGPTHRAGDADRGAELHDSAIVELAASVGVEDGADAVAVADAHGIGECFEDQVGPHVVRHCPAEDPSAADLGRCSQERVGTR